jgi:hypothetical protein
VKDQAGSRHGPAIKRIKQHHDALEFLRQRDQAVLADIVRHLLELLRDFLRMRQAITDVALHEPVGFVGRAELELAGKQVQYLTLAPETQIVLPER